MPYQDSSLVKSLYTPTNSEQEYVKKLETQFKDLCAKNPDYAEKFFGPNNDIANNEIRGGVLPSQDPAAPLGISDIVYRVWDPRQKINTPRHLCIYQGGNNTNIVQIPVVSVSNSQLQWNYPVPSNVIVGNEWMVQLNITFTFTGVGYNGGQLLVFGKYDGIRDLPLHKVLNSVTNKMNNQTFTVNPAQYIDALSRYIPDHDRNKYFSGTGAMPDQFFNYADANSLGSNRNPLAFYGENAKMATRGSLQYDIVSNTNTSAIVNVTIIEPLLISPLMYGYDGDNHSGFPSLQNINLQLQLANLVRMWSHANAPDSGSITEYKATINAAYLNVVQITPDQNLNPILFDKPYIFNYNNLTAYPSPAVQITYTGQSMQKTLVSGQLQVNAIPSRIYIWARRQDADQSPATSDTFAVINSINITWDNQNSLLANATSNDLWRMSVKNGLQMNYPQWSTYTGSVLCVELGSDIGLLPNQAPGLTGKYQFSVRGTFTNPSSYNGSSDPEDVNYILYVLPVIPGSVVFQGNTCNIKEGLFESSEEILMAQYTTPIYSRRDAVHSSMYGGSFLGDLWDKVKDVGRKVVSALPKVLPIAEKAVGFLAPQYNPVIQGIRGITGMGTMGGRRHMYGKGMEFQEDEDDCEPQSQTYQLPNGQKMIGNSYVSPGFNQFANQDFLAQHKQMINTNVPGMALNSVGSINFPSNVSRNNGAAEIQMLQAQAQQSYNNALHQGPKTLMNNMASERNYLAHPNLYEQQSNYSYQPPYNKYTQGIAPRRIPAQASGGCGDCVGSVSKNELRERLMNPPRGNGMNFSQQESVQDADQRLLQEVGLSN